VFEGGCFGVSNTAGEADAMCGVVVCGVFLGIKVISPLVVGTVVSTVDVLVFEGLLRFDADGGGGTIVISTLSLIVV
jgi:hypothetical protein